MKFNVAWSETLSQNVILRITILCLSGALVALLVALAKVSLKEPVIIERACFSSALEKASGERTETEISSFLKEALARRFDTEVGGDTLLLSEEEIGFRNQEQRDLKEKGIHQRIIFNRVQKIDGTQVAVDCDRLISVGPVRSAFAFPLSVTIGSIQRSEANPYGLRLIRVKPLDSEKKNEK